MYLYENKKKNGIWKSIGLVFVTIILTVVFMQYVPDLFANNKSNDVQSLSEERKIEEQPSSENNTKSTVDIVDLIVFQIVDIVLLMVFIMVVIAFFTPWKSPVIRALMPLTTAPMMVLIAFQIVVNTVLIAFITVITTVLMVFHTVVITVWITVSTV